MNFKWHWVDFVSPFFSFYFLKLLLKHIVHLIFISGEPCTRTLRLIDNCNLHIDNSQGLRKMCSENQPRFIHTEAHIINVSGPNKHVTSNSWFLNEITKSAVCFACRSASFTWRYSGKNGSGLANLLQIFTKKSWLTDLKWISSVSDE